MENKLTPIRAFIEDLWAMYGNNKQVCPFTLYHRLYELLKNEDTVAAEKFIKGFAIFLSQFGKFVVSEQWSSIPKGTKIRYDTSEKAYIDMYTYLRRSDKETTYAIRAHLMAIGAALFPNVKIYRATAVAASSSSPHAPGDVTHGINLPVDVSTPEGRLINNLTQRITDTLGDTEIDTSTPMNAVMGLMASGALNDIMEGIQESAHGGIDSRRLMRTLHSAMGQMLDQSESQSRIENTASEPQTENVD
jgi:hypothetical protein